MMSSEEIRQTLQAHKAQLFSKYLLTSLALFGLYADGTATGESDCGMFDRLPNLLLVDMLEAASGIVSGETSRNGADANYLLTAYYRS